MSDDTREGWVNYGTWAVFIWFDNDQASHNHWCDVARQHREMSATRQQVLSGTWTAADAAKYHLADQLKEKITAGAPDVLEGAYSDLLDAAFDEVRWDEIAAHYLEKTEALGSTFGPVVFSYTRAQAIADGLLVDVCKMATEAGIKYHTALTVAVWQQYVVVPDGVEGQDEQGRLWDIRWMLRHAILTHKCMEASQIQFQLMVRNTNRQPEQVTLMALCGPGDQAEPVITVMLPHED